MAKRKSKNVTPEYSLLAIKISSYTAAIDASVNYEVRDRHHYRDDAKVYSFESRLEIEGVCTYPEERELGVYSITVYGTARHADQFALTLEDCHIRGDHGVPVYRKVRGKEVPVYDIPKSIGMLDRRRGTQSWHGWLWVPPRTVTDMLSLLPHVRPLYLGIHELREGRQHWIVGLTLQTADPATE